MYIVLEGSKGTGKSTLFQKLASALQHDGMQFEVFSPTQPAPIDMLWEKVDAGDLQNDAQIEALYTARANYHAQQTDFNAPLILGDRSILTSIITRWPDNPDNVAAYIQQVRSQEYAVPIPDFVIYLDLSIETTLKRLAARQRHYGLRDEQIERLIDAKMAYETFFKVKNNFGFHKMNYQYFNAEQNTEALFTQVYAVLKEQLLKQSTFQFTS